MTETARVRRGNVPASQSLKMETNVAVPMRDGTILYACLFNNLGHG
jgi:predicted acyl esterase